MEIEKVTASRLEDLKQYEVVIDRLLQRGVSLPEIAEITYELQQVYIPTLTRDYCLEHVKKVVKKREVQHAVLTGLELDILAEKGLLSEPLLSMLLNDYGLYGIDEIMALSIVNVYGSIGFTNFGYVDKIKPGIIGVLDEAGKKKASATLF